jgi:hypothetical protein
MSTYDKASLVLIPSGTKEGVVFSQKPTNGDGDFTFSRSTAATRVNADGLIEKETQNLLFPSEGTTTGWIATGIGTNTSSILTGQQDPNGGTQGYRWTATCGATTSDRAWYRKNITSGGEVYTFSFWVKSATGSDQNLGFHFSGGTGTPLTATSSWQRVERYGTTGAGTAYFGIEIRGTLTDQSADVYIYGMQLEYGLVARDYIETTTAAVYGGITDNVPRLDYTGGATCPALLLEPQRTNLNPYSEYFGTFWNSLGNETITSNYGVSPEGLSNATRFQATSAGRGGIYANIAVNNGTTYTLSFYAKSLSGAQKLRIGADNGCVNPQGAETFEVTTEWQKFTTTITSTQNSWNIFFDNVESGIGCSGTYLNCDMLVYAYQLEAGSYATSYIPTYGTSVTFANDVCSKTGISSLIGQTEGTLFLEIDAVNFETDQRFAISDGTAANRIALRMASGGAIQLSVVIESVTQASISGSGSVGNTYKIAGAYKENDFVLYINGSLIDTDTSGSVSGTFSRLATDRGVSGQDFYNPIKQALLFKTRLSNEELADLTTI